MYFYIILFTLFIFLYFFGAGLRHRWFAFLMSFFQSGHDARYRKLKKDLFKSLSTLQSKDPQLKKENRIKILEVGVGTGVNFEFYPNGTKLVVVDPNPHFDKYYDANRKKFENIHSEEIIVTTGEEMDMVPSSSVDAVVVTLVLCSVMDTKRILEQVKRVLVPGGKFYFLEHIVEFETSKHYIRHFLQNLLTYAYVWPLFFDGCCLNRDTGKAIEEAGFKEVDLKRIHAPMDQFIFEVITPHLLGTATK